MRRILSAALFVVVVALAAHGQTPPPREALAFSTNWRDLWPSWTPAATPPAGWETCEGYPERRNFIEAQWHDAAGGDLEHARHLHIGGCFPEKARGVFQIDLRIMTFHWGDSILNGLRKNPCRNCDGLKRVAPSPVRADLFGAFRMPLKDHIHKVWLPVRYDTRGMPKGGNHLMEFDADIQRADGGHHLVRLQVPLFFDPTGTTDTTGLVPGAGTFGAEGWTTLAENGVVISPFGYLRAEVHNWKSQDPAYRMPRFEGETVPEWRFRPVENVAGRLNQGAVFMNPDLHQHPPFYGAVLLPDTAKATKKQVFVVRPPWPQAGDRFVFRSSDQTPGLSYGAAATLLVITTRKGQ